MSLKNGLGYKLSLFFFGLAALFPISMGALNFYEMLIEYQDLQSTTDIRQLKHIASVNLICTGVSAFCVAWFGVRKKEQWCWLLGLFYVLWVGVNDTIASILNPDDAFPIALLPTIFSALGLILSYYHVFRGNKNT